MAASPNRPQARCAAEYFNPPAGAGPAVVYNAAMDIHVRHAEPDDFQAMHQIYSQPGVIRGTMQLPFSSPEKRRKFLADIPEGTYSLVACVDEQVIGQLNLNTYPNSPRRRHMGTIGMAVHDEWQGKGVGTRLMQAALELADRWLNLRRVQLEVFTDNQPAIRLYQKAGFEIEGTLRDFAFRDGEFVDVYVMGRLRS